MTSSTSAHSVDREAKGSPGLRILRVVLILLGLALVVFSVLLPVLMGAPIESGAGTLLRSSYVRMLTPFITDVSMASSFVAVVVILTFEKSKANAGSVLFGILTLSVICAEIALSLYISLVRPLTTRAPSLLAIYLLIGLVPLGLGCTMFTLASVIHGR